MTIKQFIKTSPEYDHYRKYGTWNNYTVYSVWNKASEGAKIGLPTFALVEDDTIRLANPEETIKIMGRGSI